MSHYKELAKHSANYLLANLATKALVFISIPIYTRLLTVEEYGIFNVFMSTVGIASIILTLNTEVAISRYYYDAESEEDFKKFVGTSVKLSLVIFFITSLIFIILSGYFSDVLKLEKLLVIFVIPVSLYNVSNSVFQQIYIPLLKSKKIAVVSSLQIYLAFILSVIVILMLDSKRYYGQVWGTIAAMVIVGFYMVGQIKRYYKSGFEKKYIKYILNYSLPYLPYSLSGVIIVQFGRLVANDSGGANLAGTYSFVANISSIMMMFIATCHSAWNPYYFRYMNDGDKKSIVQDYDILWKITLLLALVLILFGKDFGTLLGRKEFLRELYLLPFFVIGYVFYQWSYVYLRNTGYAKKMIWNAVAVLLAGCSNIVMNILFVPLWNVVGIALSFTLSYFFMLVVSYLINRYILKMFAPSLFTFLMLFIEFFLITIVSLKLIHMINWEYYTELVFKTCVIFLTSILMLRKYIKKTF